MLSDKRLADIREWAARRSEGGWTSMAGAGRAVAELLDEVDDLRAKLTVLRDAAEERLPEAERRIDALMAKNKRLKPLAEIGAAVRKLAEHDWFRESDGGPCLVYAYTMAEDPPPDGGDEFIPLGWGVTDISFEGGSPGICDWKPTPEAALAAAGLMPAVEGGEPD